MLSECFSETKGDVAPVVVVSFDKSFCLRIGTLEFSTVGQKHSGAALGIEREIRRRSKKRKAKRESQKMCRIAAGATVDVNFLGC